MENPSIIIVNNIKEIRNVLNELIVCVQKNNEEYVHQLKIINTVIQKVGKKQANLIPYKSLRR